ncbi:MAG: cytochrome c [Actinobacteria bacterium]|nr:cytochrome c [Actinomycetota bacterium]MBV8395894.1 cytochrome c [Actinomycetota bacterium]MBV8599521.1 cytochrome c [Actinomycetota bacterium]
MRRVAPLLLVGLLAAGCSDSKPGGSVVSPVPGNRLVHVTAPKGDPAKGKAVFTANGCAACHTFAPAGATGKVGPDLDKLADYAAKAGIPLDQFASTAVTSPPPPYVPPGYPKNVMPSTFSSLPAQQLADLVAFLTQGK